jgi:UDP-N-acetylmuramyl pentapeptide phosphotransferase/UDP-N-acetylglucosamine-1-phosphate transferase
MNDPKPDNAKPDNAKSDSRRDSPRPQENRTPAMAGLAIAVVLLVVGLWLAHELTAASKMQDCLMSGRTNCNVIQPQ